MINVNNLVAGASLTYEAGDWRARLGYSWVRTLLELPIHSLIGQLRDPVVNRVWPNANSLVGRLSTKDSDAHFAVIGLAYDNGTWLAQTEISYNSTPLDVYPSLFSSYLSVGRRFGSVTLYSLLGIAETVHSTVKLADPLIYNPQLIELKDGVDSLLNRTGVDEKSVSLGARWDVYQNVALKAQWSHYWVGGNSAQLWKGRPIGDTGVTVNVWSLAVDFLF